MLTLILEYETIQQKSKQNKGFSLKNRVIYTRRHFCVQIKKVKKKLAFFLATASLSSVNLHDTCCSKVKNDYDANYTQNETR